jgi:prolyl-tRNA editing enzyme YbaK/EbsC (Cys-tRNA(Pro) deacylase)
MGIISDWKLVIRKFPNFLIPNFLISNPMPINKKLIKLLDDSKIKHTVVSHKIVYTAYDAAATMKVKLKEIAKSLLVKFNKPFEAGVKPYAIAMVPADKNLDLKKLAKVVSDAAVKLNKDLRNQKPLPGKKQLIDLYNKISKVEIPKEKAIKDKLKINPGALSAFGSLYKLPVFVDKAMKGELILSSGAFTESIKMSAGDFIKLEKAFVGKFSIVRKIKKSNIKKRNK